MTTTNKARYWFMLDIKETPLKEGVLASTPQIDYYCRFDHWLNFHLTEQRGFRWVSKNLFQDPNQLPKELIVSDWIGETVYKKRQLFKTCYQQSATKDKEYDDRRPKKPQKKQVRKKPVAPLTQKPTVVNKGYDLWRMTLNHAISPYKEPIGTKTTKVKKKTTVRKRKQKTRDYGLKSYTYDEFRETHHYI